MTLGECGIDINFSVGTITGKHYCCLLEVDHSMEEQNIKNLRGLKRIVINPFKTLSGSSGLKPFVLFLNSPERQIGISPYW